MITFLLKLVIGTSFFFTYYSIASETKKSLAVPGGQISVTATSSENLTGIMKFHGQLGTWIVAETESMSKPCLPSAQFRKVFYQNRMQIEVYFKLVCPATQQQDAPQTLLAPRYFIDEKASTNEILLTAMSADLKKIRLRFSEIKFK